MEKQTRLKKFKGLPHELGGLDYTYDAEVEGKIGKDGKPAIGEYGYTPKGSKDEFIFRKKSSNIKELEKQDKLRKNRPEGDRISDMSFDAVAKELMLDESQQLASEGIDPFNAGKDVFAVGGVNYYDDPEPEVGIPEIVDTPQESNNISAGQAGSYAAAIGGLSSSLGQLGPDDPYYSQGVGQKDTGTQALESTTDSIVGAIPLVGQFYGAGKGISSGIEAGRDDARSKDNVVGAEAAAFGAGFVDPAGSWFDLAADEKNDTLTSDQHVGAGFLNILMPGAGDAYAEKFRKQHAESQAKQVGYNESLAERGKLPQSNEVIRNRTQQFGNGGMKKKYGDGGKNEFNPDDWSKFDKNFYEEPIDADTPYVPIMDNYVISQEDADNAYNYSLDKNATWNPPTTTNNSKKKFDPNMLTSIVGGLGQMAPSLAYLFGDGKDYDKVKYPTYNPAKVTADLALKETQGAFESTRQVLKDQGKLDLGALSDLATQEAKARSGVRENIANVNTGMMNDAQLKNIGFTVQAMNDEAANKGQYQTNKLQEQKNIAQAAALTARQYNMGSNDEIRKQLIASMVDQKFTELYPS
jgi:hypothetical protein